MSKFVLCTKDFSGLGFALMLKEEGQDVIVGYGDPDIKKKKPEEQDAYNLVGEGLVDCIGFDGLFSKRAQHKDAYWIFDTNHHSDKADQLRSEGFKVWGTSEITESLEHDRDVGVEIAQKHGLDIPETEEFSDAEPAIAFLEKNEDKSYVCKPHDSESHLTYVPQSESPASANKELRSYIRSMADGENFILQEKIKGVESNTECFFFQGEPYFAWVDLECKRKNSGDKGELVGCAQDIGFIVDLNKPIVQRVVGPLFPFFQRLRYTGFADVNVILSDNRIYFLEFCARFGYNAHPMLFRSLLIAPFGETLIQMIDGPDENFYDRFRKGFGSSITMYIDHPQMGLPIFITKDVAKWFYAYELYQDKDTEDKEEEFSLAGFSNEVGVICGHAYAMVDSAKNALDNALKVNFPLCGYREDLNETDFPSSPIKRFEALDAMGMI
jgi:phosphoribosylamine-glycine ligase